MITRMTPKLTALMTAACLAFAMGCTDDPSSSSNDSPGENVNNDTPSETIDETSQLRFADDEACNIAEQTCGLTPAVGDSISLSVQLTTADETPISNALIDFQKESIQDASEASLSAGSAFTDSNGVAEVNLFMGEDPEDAIGQLHVTASVADDDDVNDLEFHLGITPKDGAAYVIEYIHEGQANPDDIQTRLYDPSQSCDDAIDEFFNGSGHWPSAEMMLPSVQVAPDGSIPNSTPPAQNNDAFTVLAVAVQNIGNESVEVAYGCNDDAEPVELGVNVHVEVPLTDHVPHFEERYEMTHHFNLAAAMPESVQTVINIVSTLADSPAEFILGCPEDDDDCSTDVGLIDLLFELEFLEEQEWLGHIETIRDGPLYYEAAEYLNGLIDEYILDNLPSWAADSIHIAGDITDMLEAFTVRGPMFFDEQPTPVIIDGVTVGEFNGVAHQRWHEIVLQLSLGCEDSSDPEACAETTIGANDVGTSDIIEGHFDATVHGTDYIEIEQHHLTLHYGALLIGIIEQVALPRLFDDPTINSLDAALAQLISCSDLASSIGSFETTVETVCDELLENATDAVYGYVTDSLVADGEDQFMLSTPIDEPCTIQQPQSYSSSGWPGEPLPYIDSIGMSDDEGSCTWKTEIDYDSSGTVDFEIPGDFYGAIH